MEMWIRGSRKRSLERERYWLMRSAGVRDEAITVELGVARSTLAIWQQERGGVAPRPKQQPSGRYLSEDDRVVIGMRKAAGWTNAQIAAELGKDPTTIWREVRRNSDPLRSAGHKAREYHPLRAQRRAAKRAERPKQAKLRRDANPDLHDHVQDKLSHKWSPKQIATTLRLEFPDRPDMWVSHETIYQSIYVQSRGALKRELASCLRTGRAIRQPKRREGQRRPRVPAELLISERPPEIEDRHVPGHWEGDLIVGADNGSAIGTLVERTSRFAMLLHLPDRHGAEQVRDAIIATITTLPEALRRSLTWDQGIELVRHEEIRFATDLTVWFCDPHSPWQRGTNENTNGLLRQYFPKGTDLSMHSAEHLRFVADELNDRPRETLGWKSPRQVLTELIATTA